MALPIVGFIIVAAYLLAPFLEATTARLVYYLAGFLSFLVIGGAITFGGGRKTFLVLLIGSLVLVLALIVSPVLHWTGLINGLAVLWPITAWPALISAIVLFVIMVCGVFTRLFSDEYYSVNYLGSD